MKINKADVTETRSIDITVTVDARIDSGLPTKKSFSDTTFIPESIRVVYKKVDDNPWKKSSILIVGKALLAGGRLGREVRDTWVVHTMAAWVESFIDENMPTD